MRTAFLPADVDVVQFAIGNESRATDRRMCEPKDEVDIVFHVIGAVVTREF